MPGWFSKPLIREDRQSLNFSHPMSKRVHSSGNHLEPSALLSLQNSRAIHSVPPLDKAQSQIQASISSLLTLSPSLQPDTNYILPWPNWKTPQALSLHTVLFFICTLPPSINVLSSPHSVLLLSYSASALLHLHFMQIHLWQFVPVRHILLSVSKKVCRYVIKTSWFQQHFFS